jgi:hypothetical protein
MWLMPFFFILSCRLNCSEHWEPTEEYGVTLNFPDTVVDQDGNVGFWTLIYNQGFEVVINNRKFFAFSYYEMHGNNVTSMYSTTFPGWVHNIDESYWGCYVGIRVSPSESAISQHQVQQLTDAQLGSKYMHQHQYVQNLNSLESSWRAAVYPQYDVCQHLPNSFFSFYSSLIDSVTRLSLVGHDHSRDAASRRLIPPQCAAPPATQPSTHHS